MLPRADQGNFHAWFALAPRPAAPTLPLPTPANVEA